MYAADANNKATAEEEKLPPEDLIGTIGVARGHLPGGPPFFAGRIGRFQPDGAA
jgi:hypothetical protein